MGKGWALPNDLLSFLRVIYSISDAFLCFIFPSSCACAFDFESLSISLPRFSTQRRSCSITTTMSIILPSTRWSLFPSCPDPSLANSANKNLRRLSTRSTHRRTISDFREATDLSLSHANREKKRNKAIVDSVSKQSPAMGRLIPFKLQLCEEDRSHLNSPQPKSRTPTISSLTSPTSRKSRPGPVTDLLIIPYTEDEWKSVMEEVKILYLKGQYKQCSRRSKSILENIKDSVSIHNPLFQLSV